MKKENEKCKPSTNPIPEYGFTIIFKFSYPEISTVIFMLPNILIYIHIYSAHFSYFLLAIFNIELLH